MERVQLLVGGAANAYSSVVTSGYTITTTFISLQVHVATHEEKIDSLQVQVSHVEQKQ